jgi:hypothetical protein
MTDIDIIVRGVMDELQAQGRLRTVAEMVQYVRDDSGREHDAGGLFTGTGGGGEKTKKKKKPRSSEAAGPVAPKYETATKAEIDKHIKSGHREVFRGVTHKDFAAKMRRGEHFTGEGDLGSGIYTNPELHQAEGYAGADGEVLRGVLKKDAKTITIAELDKRQRADADAGVVPHTMDYGTYAKRLGYDAISRPHDKHINIVNPEKFIVQSDPHKIYDPEDDDDIEGAFQAIKPGEYGHVRGHLLRRENEDTYRMETPTGHVTGTPEDIQRHIAGLKEHEERAKPMIDAALKRADAAPDLDPFRHRAELDAEAKAFDKLPHGAHVVALEPHVRGRLGQVVRTTENGKRQNRVKLHGSADWHTGRVEPLDPAHSLVSKRTAKVPEARPRQGTLFQRGIDPAQYAADKGRWITIGAKSVDGERKGGSPVFVDKSGRITKGHPSLHGKKIDALSEDDSPTADRKAGEPTHRQELHASKGYARAVWAKKAKKEGIKPEYLHQMAGELLAHDKAFKDEKTAVLKEARRALGEFGGGAKNLHHHQGKDFIRGADEVGEDLAVKYPHMFHGGSASDQLMEMLHEGNPEPMTEDEAYEQAFEQLRDKPVTAGEPVADVPFDDQFQAAGEPVQYARSIWQAPLPADRLGDGTVQYAKGLFDEEEHPRDDSGEFTAKGGSGSSESEDESDEEGDEGEPVAGRFYKAPAKKVPMVDATRDGKKIRLADGSEAPTHIQDIAGSIAPDWKDVKIAVDPDAEVLATGIAPNGKAKTIRSASYDKRAAVLKFVRSEDLLANHAKIMGEIQRDRHDPAKREEADVSWLMLEQATRPGSETDNKGVSKFFGHKVTADDVIETKSDDHRIAIIGTQTKAQKAAAARGTPVLTIKVGDDLVIVKDKKTKAELLRRKAAGEDLQDTSFWLKSHGATTLEGRHVVQSKDGVRLQFVGKEGVWHDHLVKDQALAKMLTDRKEASFGKLFKTNENKVLKYVDERDGGGYLNKDLRTGRANIIARQEIAKLPQPKDKKEYKSCVQKVAEAVAHVLGNEWKQCIKSYINPEYFSSWQVKMGGA